uniref:Helicase ATP-binding domain-containing protein n=1 Tax=Anopheles christyi TaxID=43041 RepID=A0A182JZE0_9DIPT
MVREQSPDKAPSPSSPVVENMLNEKNAFNLELTRKRQLQLEALEKKLAGFAKFNQEHPKKNVRAREITDNRKLRNIENLRKDDYANNNNEDAIEFTETPSFINATMRDYQIAGLNWLISLYKNNLNGILADEMGLGKTIQSISMIGYLLFVRKLKGPFLVVVPLSTVPNWMNEFARFLPGAKVFRAHMVGPQKTKIFDKLRASRPTWNVAITSYEFITNHSVYFKSINFHYAIIDEGHRAKNENTLFAGTLRRCKIQSMVMLTGTPVHNNLHELWALLNLLMPLFFNNAENFDSWFKVEDCVDPKHEQTIRLKKLLKPLLLRRTKKEVTNDIPPKVHIDIYVPPTEQMCVWTHKVLHHDVKQMGGNGEMKRMSIINRMPHLRKVIQHPYLLPGVENCETILVTDDIVQFSSKMIVLDKLLERLRARGSRVLIFSQFVKVLYILMDYLDWREYEYCMLDGDTKIAERQEQMDEFNRSDSTKFVFLLSTRAGGLGINLPAADTVIFYDMDFNPQMDFQAEDRAHRIGQQRKVHVFRLLVRGSIDELLYLHSERKRQLDEAVIRAETNPSKQLLMSAYEYQRTSLMANGLIDKAAVDEKLDELFRTMGKLTRTSSPDSGVLEDCQIMLPGVSCDLKLDTVLGSIQLAEKRKAEEAIVPLLGKRLRRSVHGDFY